jgi:hypothetical protein
MEECAIESDALGEECKQVPFKLLLFSLEPKLSSSIGIVISNEAGERFSCIDRSVFISAKVLRRPE